MTDNSTTSEHMKARILGVCLLALATAATAQQLPFPSARSSSGLLMSSPYVQDSGRISKFYVYGDEVAIALDGGFPNAVASNVCPSSSGYFAGNKTPSKSMVAALMTARASGSKVFVTYGGCDGPWFKITDVYIVD